MNNVLFEMGRLILEATHELEKSHRDMSVTKSLIAKKVVGSAPALS